MTAYVVLSAAVFLMMAIGYLAIGAGWIPRRPSTTADEAISVIACFALSVWGFAALIIHWASP